MITIPFWLKSDIKQANLKYITISDPKKILKGKLIGVYFCEINLPDTEIKKHFIYAENPTNAFYLSSKFVKIHLQGLINRGYIVGEGTKNEDWKLEKKNPQACLQEKMSEIKKNRQISHKDKEKILEIMKETFGKIPHMKDQFKNINISLNTPKIPNSSYLNDITNEKK